MDTYEILSDIRSFLGTPNEDDQGSIQLVRMINLGHSLLTQEVTTLFHEFLTETQNFSSQTGSSVAIPENLLQVLSLERKDSNSDFQPTSPVSPKDKPLIDKDLNYVSSEKYPLHVHEGQNLEVYPTLSSTDVRLRYRRRVEDLFWGSITRGTDTTATLPAAAVPVDDIYNGYRMGIYSETSGVWTFQGLALITDYVGSTKVATVSGVTISVGTSYWAALCSIIPTQFHNLILDAAILQAKRLNRYKDQFPGFSFAEEQAVLINRIQSLMKSLTT
jgi:hypothetical protein